MVANEIKGPIELEPGEKPTLKTISRISGLAVPTVSRALNDAPDIGAETKRLIQRIASEIGYVPNRAGVRLRTGKTNVISLILSPESDMMNHTAQLITSVARTLRNTPYHLIITHFFPDEDKMRPVRYIVETRSADAIILNQTEPQDARIAYLMEHKFPFVAHGRSDWADQHPYFDYDNVEFGRIAVEQLVAKGRRHIVVIAPPRAQFYSAEMIRGSVEAAAQLGVYLRPLVRVTSDSGGEMIRSQMAKVLAEEPQIDGIICGSHVAAMGSVAAAENAGRVLGQDIDIFGKEAVPFLKLFRKELMVLPENVDRAGAFLAQAAMQAINEPDLPPMQGLEVPSADDMTK